MAKYTKYPGKDRIKSTTSKNMKMAMEAKRGWGTICNEVDNLIGDKRS